METPRPGGVHPKPSAASHLTTAERGELSLLLPCIHPLCSRVASTALDTQGSLSINWALRVPLAGAAYLLTQLLPWRTSWRIPG